MKLKILNENVASINQANYIIVGKKTLKVYASGDYVLIKRYTLLSVVRLLSKESLLVGEKQ